jgi:hypothetical protein
MNGIVAEAVMVYEYTVRLAGGRAGRTALTFLKMDGGRPVARLRCPKGTVLRSSGARSGRLALFVPKPENADEYDVLDAASAVDAARADNFRLTLEEIE